MFIEKGFKDTAVSDITKRAGVGVGTFYNFYPSKEEVFLEVFLSENMLLKREIMKSVDINGDPEPVFKQMISRLFIGMSASPILREWYKRDTLVKIQEKLASDPLGHDVGETSYNLVANLIREFQAQGKLRGDLDMDLTMAMFNSLSFIDLHKQDIGSVFFPELIDRLVEAIVISLKPNM